MVSFVLKMEGRKCGVSDKEKIYYERGTKELKFKNIRAHKLVREFNNSDMTTYCGLPRL
jgi:hypothetical protein